MAHDQHPDPGAIVSENDPGDDTASRYRYQWTWAAVLCCMMLDTTHDVEEVLCEQHEDILIKHKNGRYSGIQVKTRSSNQEVWKSSQDVFIKSCAKFVKLHVKFPDSFCCFKFLTNHPLHGAKNSEDPAYALEQLTKAHAISSLQAPIKSWVRKVAKEAGCSEEEAFSALKKVKVSDSLPKLEDALNRLINTLTDCWEKSSDCSHEAVKRSANALIDECGRASALDHLQVLPAYITALPQPDEAELRANLDNKRMTIARVKKILEEGLVSTAALEGDETTLGNPTDGSKDLLLRKLEAGGFSAVSVNSAVDLRAKAEYLGLSWINKYGKRNGLQRYSHVRSIVLREASGSFESKKTEESQFGPAMREDLCERLKNHRKLENDVYDCADGHLEGLAYILTAQCQVRWSTDTPWEDQ